jgi:hypothetical protein
VAELSRRPLLALTSGDLGNSAADLDWKLSMYFRLRELWDTIVLIDEADIYFQNRDLDTERNGLVQDHGKALPSLLKGDLILRNNACRREIRYTWACIAKCINL